MRFVNFIVACLIFYTSVANAQNDSVDTKPIFIKIEFGGNYAFATLQRNETTEDFAKKMPITLSFTKMDDDMIYESDLDLNRTNNDSIPYMTIHEGEIMYEPFSKRIFLASSFFFKEFKYIKLGEIKRNAKILKDIVYQGDLTFYLLR